jgi:hypothetical protein
MASEGAEVTINPYIGNKGDLPLLGVTVFVEEAGWEHVTSRAYVTSFWRMQMSAGSISTVS